jgi:hypothetical protein
MMRRWARMTALVLVALLGLPALADAPRQSLRPQPRATVQSAVAMSMRPALRPVRANRATTATVLSATVPPERHGLFWKRKARKTSVCGDVDLQGEEIGDIPGRLPGCGARNAVRLRSVAGVSLSTPAVMTCDTARALGKWVDGPLQRAFRRQGPVREIRVASGYACRTRNNRPGAKISEHGKGRAIDLAAFTMADGTVSTVKDGWNGPRKARRALHKAYGAACGTFGTTLGPDSDAYHRDHFHFDTARYRSGPYCQ